MVFNGQKILPAIKSMKDFEKIVGGEHTFIVILDMHLSKLASLKKLAREAGKKLIIHADLIQGLKSDRAAAEFLCQVIKPAGLISTRAEVLRVAKKNNVLAIQRVFYLIRWLLKRAFNKQIPLSLILLKCFLVYCLSGLNEFKKKQELM